MTLVQTQSKLSKVKAIKTIGDLSRIKQLLLIQEFQNVFNLTQDEPDFPRKLLKYYNITSQDKLTDRDILLLIGKCFTIKPRLTKEDKKLDDTYAVLENEYDQ